MKRFLAAQSAALFLLSVAFCLAITFFAGCAMQHDDMSRAEAMAITQTVKGLKPHA